MHGFVSTSCAGASLAALLFGQAHAQDSAVLEEVIVSAQKREESLQDVPIAVSVLDGNMLEMQRLDGGQNLLLAVPNLTFSRGNQAIFNITIRGVGNSILGPSGDAPVGIHVNGAPVIGSRMQDADFYDLERVEVLRGPQGTLYGRNSTAGLVNMITAKPKDEFEASVTADVANNNTLRLKGMVNLPLGDALSVRVAGTSLERDGFVRNTYLNADVDDRDLWSARITVGFQPHEQLEGYLLYEAFREDDSRARAQKTLCVKDPGPDLLGATPTGPFRSFFSQGCLNGSLYQEAAYGTPNFGSTTPGMLLFLFGVSPQDPYLGVTQSRDPFEISAAFKPIYKVDHDTYLLNLEYRPTDTLLVTSLSHYSHDRLLKYDDFYHAVPSQRFLPGPFTPAGVYHDGQLGPYEFVLFVDGNNNIKEEFSQELRVQSDFGGAWDFNLGALYISTDDDFSLEVISNGYTLASHYLNTRLPADNQIHIETRFPPTGAGHNNIVNRSETSLEAGALFGELYWRPTEDLKLTLGLRYTDDHKRVVNRPQRVLQPGAGLPVASMQEVDFRETTGRLTVDWKPHLTFTDETLLYASLARGYRGGGFNDADAATIGAPTTFKPSFVDALEIGTKNTLFDHRLTLQASLFRYEYKDYQIQRFQNTVIVNENVDSTVTGLELEAAWRPLSAFELSANLGLLETEISGGQSVDQLNLTQGDPNLVVARTSSGGLCAVPISQAEAVLRQVLANPAANASVLNGGLCRQGTLLGVTVMPTGGTLANLAGNEMPHAPDLTASVGAQYTWRLARGWSASLRGDFYHQGKSYARVFNTEHDELKSWENVNATATFSQPELGLQVQLYAKNLLDEQAIVDFVLTSDRAGNFTNAILLEPLEFGVSFTKTF